MQKKLSPRELKKSANRDAILGLAKVLFEQKGIAQTSVQEIMKNAGLGTGTFYNYFESKEELIEVLITNQISESKAYLENLTAQDLPVPELILSFLLAVEDAFSKNRVLINYLFQRRGPQLPLVAPGNHDQIFKTMVLRLLEKGQARGEITSAFSQEALWSVFHSLLQTSLLGNFSNKKEKNLKQQIEIVFQGVL